MTTARLMDGSTQAKHTSNGRRQKVLAQEPRKTVEQSNPKGQREGLRSLSDPSKEAKRDLANRYKGVESATLQSLIPVLRRKDGGRIVFLPPKEGTGERVGSEGSVPRAVSLTLTEVGPDGSVFAGKEETWYLSFDPSKPSEVTEL